MIWEKNNRKIALFVKKRYHGKGKPVLQRQIGMGISEVRFSNGTRDRIAEDSYTGKMSRVPWSNSK